MYVEFSNFLSFLKSVKRSFNKTKLLQQKVLHSFKQSSYLLDFQIKGVSLDETDKITLIIYNEKFHFVEENILKHLYEPFEKEEELVYFYPKKIR